MSNQTITGTVEQLNSSQVKGLDAGAQVAPTHTLSPELTTYERPSIDAQIAELRALLDQGMEALCPQDGENAEAMVMLGSDGSIRTRTPEHSEETSSDKTDEVWFVVAAPVVAADLLQDDKENLMSTSTCTDTSWQPVCAPVVAGSVEEQIAAMRELLASSDPDRQVTMTGDGTIINPGEASSVDTNQPLSVVDAPVVAAQWYETNPGLQQAEIEAMHAFHPSATYGFLPDGRMYWQIRIHPEVAGERKDWTFLAVYDEDHPQHRWGGSCKFYPVQPNYREMQERLDAAKVTPKLIPHVLRDDEGQAYVCSQHMRMVDAGRKKGGKVTSASGCLRNVIYWVNMFEWGLLDQAIWTEFQQHRSAR